MANNNSKDPPLSYNTYLRVPELIDLQSCLSTPAHHDELLFITVHQAYELWFKQILHEIDAAIALMKEDRAAEAAAALRRIVEIEKLLIAQIHILEVMTHEDRFDKEVQLAEGLIEHDEYFSLWRSHHIKMVERMVGAKPGTGGSEGVGYLQKTMDKKFFPELWDARTYLSSKHESEGCPFAKT